MKTSQKMVLTALIILLIIVVVVVVGLGRLAMGIGGERLSGWSNKTLVAGDRETEDMDFRDFSSLSVNSAWEVFVIQGSDWEVELDYPEGWEDRLRVRLSGSTLVLDVRNWTPSRRNREFSAFIVMPELKKITVSGSTTMVFSGFQGDFLDVNISGAAHIEASEGRYERVRIVNSGSADVSLTDFRGDSLELNNSGAGSIEGENGHYEEVQIKNSGLGSVDLNGITTVDAEVRISGAGDVKLNMGGGVLSGGISGLGSIRYSGHVREQRVNISGLGGVEPEG